MQNLIFQLQALYSHRRRIGFDRVHLHRPPIKGGNKGLLWGYSVGIDGVLYAGQCRTCRAGGGAGARVGVSDGNGRVEPCMHNKQRSILRLTVIARLALARSSLLVWWYEAAGMGKGGQNRKCTLCEFECSKAAILTDCTVRGSVRAEHQVCDTYTDSRGKLDLSAQGGRTTRGWGSRSTPG